MLKALELSGFKSFADKTRFEFPDGITVVVGPNGSGKSNVVDAIRWVLGEQSAKSLRGNEMADVIFKGSGNAQRKPANTAEVTIVFDNSEGRLDVEAPEVRVSRRVYRSGEGEYLINAEPCRLRDIRDLFRGTGVGTDAYSLIEQGKVDTLLQASPRERRAIFEEAAGISRFKAKKLESQRRLDRVEQNLLRLSDIVEEVERRLKSLRNQATKARRYREYSERLKELRTHVGLTDYRAISSEWEHVTAELTEISGRLAGLETRSQLAETEVNQADGRLLAIRRQSTEHHEALIGVREHITSHEARVQLQHRTLRELTQDTDRTRHRLLALRGQAGATQQQLEEAHATLATANDELEQLRTHAHAEAQRLTELDASIGQEQAEIRQRQVEHQQQVAATGKLQEELSQLEANLRTTDDALDRETQRDAGLLKQLEAAREAADTAGAEETRLQEQLNEALTQTAGAQTLVDQQQRELEQLKSQKAQGDTQLAAARERASVLEEVERRAEGIGAGTKDLLSQARGQSTGPLGEVCGMVADLIEVKVEMAPLIDAALGDRAQFIVVSGQRLIRALAAGNLRLRGRVGLLPASLPRKTGAPSAPLTGDPHVLGRATDFVQVDPAWQEMAERLLGSTWIVRSLEDALTLSEQSPSDRFVTSAGEVLEADGTIYGGPRLSSGGIVSRRSELRALRAQISKLSQEEQLLTQQLAKRSELQKSSEQRLSEWTETQQAAQQAYAKAHAKAEAARQLVAQQEAQQAVLKGELGALEAQRLQLVQHQGAADARVAELDQLVVQLERMLSEQEQQLRTLAEQRTACEQASTEHKFRVAKAEQQVETLQIQLQRCQQDSHQRAAALADLQQQQEQSDTRYAQTSREILQATSTLAEMYLRVESHEQDVRQLALEEEQLTADRRMRIAEVKSARQEMQADQRREHELKLQAGELRLKREAVAERLRDDYGIELAAVEEELADQGGRDEIEQEIGELRRKLSNIGAVNMESLAELEDLEERFGSLSTQYNDLIEAKESLQRIIQRINIDSRKMFVDTLDIIRAGFQALFRKAFGGGVADIVVEEDVDILDAGIDIIATPPGKHSLNISLLSGGERALTAVTLLLAIFRHRPSPFCILDEVDGPLDEANIGRFVDVLKEFLQTTKVVIVTHSKKTMAAATTLYGVTMQESGVSKRVSVQFNDVREDGSIREPAERDSDDEAAA